jgi:hypothetical protein
MRTLVPTLACLTLLFTACERAPRLDTRTFAVHNLAPHQVEALVGPYVFMDRPSNPGVMSSTDNALTVRETPDNLEKIARVLEEYDKPTPDVRLRFQVIEADGFTDTDPSIADVEAELRKLFQFRGYRLVAQAMLTVTGGSRISQTLSGGDGRYMISGDATPRSGNATGLQLRLWHGEHDVILETAVSVRPGQTLVLGTSPKAGSTATLLLTVHADPADAAPQGQN